MLVAGKGTRMNSMRPKVLHPLCGLSLLERTLRAILPLNPTEIVVVIGPEMQQVTQELDRIKALAEFSKCSISSTIQEQQNGTGGASKVGLAACSKETNYIAILPGDIPLLSSTEIKQLFSDENKLPDLQILSCNHPQPTGFGRILRDSANKVYSIIEERDATEEQRAITEINSSIYLVSRAVLQENLSKLTSANAQGELYLTDIVSLAVDAGKTVEANCVAEYTQLAGANTRVELSVLEQHRRTQLITQLQLAGVSFEDPQTCYIEEAVSIGQDSWIGANTRLLGTTRIGSGVVIEGDSRISNSEIGDECHLKLGCYISEAKIAAKCMLGPFVQVRPGTVLGEKVKLGNFVEVKNAQLGSGAKANHLAYIGDAEVGAESNIGAGTIFCNYDGKNKHRSVLGEKVFVGSNSVLVSPVSIGSDAYVAAGSTITKDIPSGALGLGRSKQANIEGWVAKRRAATTKNNRSE